MCQNGSAKINQFMSALGSRSPRPNSESSAMAAAKVMKKKWIESPKHLAAVHLGDSTNELRGLICKEKDHPKETKIARAIVEEICQDPPTELLKDAEFMIIRHELAEAIGKILEDFQ